MRHYIFRLLLVVENTEMENTVAVNGNVVLNCCHTGVALIRYGTNVGPTTGRVALLRQVSQERLGSVTRSPHAKRGRDWSKDPT
jgi:hypothetical protein